MTSSNRTTAPAQAGMVRREDMPNWLAGPLSAYIDNQAFELILPSVPVQAELGYAHKVAVSVVRISANPDDKEVFPVGKRGKGEDAVEVFAYSKVAIEKMAEAAGIQVKTDRVDDRKDPDYCEVVAWAAMKGSSGQPIIRTARKAFHMRDVADEAWRNRVARRDFAKSKGWSNGKVTDDQLKREHEAEMSSFKKHLVARVETGAVLRVMRSLLAIKSGLTRQQIEKPKVLARVEFNPDPSDPVARQFMLEKGYEASVSLFGPTNGHSGGHAPRVRAVEVIEELEDENPQLGGGEPETEPEPDEAPTVTPAPQTQMPLGEKPDYLSQVLEGCNALGFSSEDRNALFLRHKGDMKAAFLELNERANQAAS